MKVLIQRVTQASVEIAGRKTASIRPGYVLMVGIARKDKEEDIYRMAEKIIKLRLFENKENKFDKELKDVNGEILVISQFTLFADCSKGKRPYFGQAEEPARANELYERFIRKLKTIYDASKIKSGKFGAKMLVEICNDGPVTIILDSADIKRTLRK